MNRGPEVPYYGSVQQSIVIGSHSPSLKPVSSALLESYSLKKVFIKYLISNMSTSKAAVINDSVIPAKLYKTMESWKHDLKMMRHENNFLRSYLLNLLKKLNSAICSLWERQNSLKLKKQCIMLCGQLKWKKWINSALNIQFKFCLEDLWYLSYVNNDFDSHSLEWTLLVKYKL